MAIDDVGQEDLGLRNLARSGRRSSVPRAGHLSQRRASIFPVSAASSSSVRVIIAARSRVKSVSSTFRRRVKREQSLLTGS